MGNGYEIVDRHRTRQAAVATGRKEQFAFDQPDLIDGLHVRKDDALSAVVEILGTQMMVEPADANQRRDPGMQGSPAQRRSLLQRKAAVFGVDEQEIGSCIGRKLCMLRTREETDAIAVDRWPLFI